MSSLVTAYIAEEDGVERQHVDARMMSRNKKLVLGCSFEVGRAEELARPIMNVLWTAKLI